MDSTEGTSDTDISLLVPSLNELLRKLHIPFPLHTPLDLTPSLLLAILESILRQRLPLSESIRVSKDAQSKVQAMKIFIGVLEDDVIGQDVGLSEVDPRKLAAGEWDEVVFIGELLVWLGKTRGYLPLHGPQDTNNSGPTESKESDVQMADVRSNTPSPSSHSTVTTHNSLNTTLSMMRTAAPDSDTSVLSMRPESPALSDLDLFEAIPRSLVHSPTPLTRRTPSARREPDGPSFSDLPGQSTFNANVGATDTPKSLCDCPSDIETLSTKKRAPVRYTGWIEKVDDDMEIQMFESRRRTSNPRTPSSHRQPAVSPSTPKTPPMDFFPEPSSTSTPRRPSSRTKSSIITRHTSPTQYHLALLNERAKLMSELANIKGSRPR